MFCPSRLKLLTNAACGIVFNDLPYNSFLPFSPSNQIDIRYQYSIYSNSIYVHNNYMTLVDNWNGC